MKNLDPGDGRASTLTDLMECTFSDREKDNPGWECWCDFLGEFLLLCEEHCVEAKKILCELKQAVYFSLLTCSNVVLLGWF